MREWLAFTGPEVPKSEGTPCWRSFGLGQGSRPSLPRWWWMPMRRWRPDAPVGARFPRPRSLVAPVAAAGRDLLVRLDRVVVIPVADDPGYEAAAGISIRFSGWMAAVFHLRKSAGGDFTGELRAILRSSRKRPDSIALRQDVVRVASFYLHEWTGGGAAPTDPPPR